MSAPSLWDCFARAGVPREHRHAASQAVAEFFTAHVEPQPILPRGLKLCADCGHDQTVHHKLHCEDPETNCYGCNGWRCPDHDLVLCGCTYLGGPSPVAASSGVTPTQEEQR